MSFNALNPQLVQDLPLDVFRYILETTGLLHVHTAKNLMLLSRTVNDWITPILYRTIVLNSDNALHSFARCIRRRNHAEFYRINVKTLWIAGVRPTEHMRDTELEDVRLVLSTCTDVINLALWIYLPNTLSPFFNFDKIVSRPMFMSFLHLPPHDISYVLPPSLTLLDFQLAVGDLGFSESTWNTLFSLCPNLTTLLLDDDYDSVTKFPLIITEMISSMLSSPRPSLKSIILRPSDFQVRYAALLDRFQSLGDSRIIIVPPYYVPKPIMAYIERRYPGMVFFLPEVTCSVTDEHHVADWTFPTPAPHSETLWERVEKWKQGGRRPTLPESFDEAQ